MKDDSEVTIFSADHVLRRLRRQHRLHPDVQLQRRQEELPLPDDESGRLRSSLHLLCFHSLHAAPSNAQVGRG